MGTRALKAEPNHWLREQQKFQNIMQNKAAPTVLTADRLMLPGWGAAGQGSGKGTAAPAPRRLSSLGRGSKP